MTNIQIVIVGLIAAFLFGQAFGEPFDPFLPLPNCAKDTDCETVISNSYCDLDRKIDCNIGVCMCRSALAPVYPDKENKPTNVTCLPQAIRIGDDCEDDNQCTAPFGEFATCVKDGTSSICQCVTGATFCSNAELHVNKCVHRKNLGEPCSGCNAQCSHIDRAICTASAEESWRCRCQTDYVESKDNSKCLLAAIEVGGDCSEGAEQCKFIKGSFCNPETRTCDCNTTIHVQDQYNRSCLARSKGLYEVCSDSKQCQTPNSYCLGSRCTCKPDFVASHLNPGTCLTSRSHNVSCDEDIQCVDTMGTYAECSSANSTCQCKHGFTYNSAISSRWGKCYPLAPIGGECQTGEQCVDTLGSSEYTMCANRKCKCVPYKNAEEIRELNGNCYKSIRLGGKCSTDDECRLWVDGPAMCNAATCQCDENYSGYGVYNCILN